MVVRILLVEDEHDILNLINIYLESNDYKVIIAEDGEEALKKARAEDPSLILLDALLPNKNGFETCRELKKNEKTRNIPIIMMSVLDRSIDYKMMKESGADEVISKPFSQEEIINLIEKTILKNHIQRFSTRINLSYDDVKGKSILLHFNALSNYEQIVKEFAEQTKANGNTVIILTMIDSSIYNIIDKTQYHFEPLSEQTLISQILSKHQGEIAIVYDSVTNLYLTMGFDAAYEILKQIKLKLSERKATSLFLINPEAHSKEDFVSFCSLFPFHIKYGPDGLKTLKWI